MMSKNFRRYWSVISKTIIFLPLFSGWAFAEVITPPTATAFPKPDRWETEEGLKVWHLNEASVPMVSIRLNFAAGSLHDHEIPGLANLSNELIGHGNATKNEQEMNEAIERLGAQISFTAQRDMAVVKLRCLAGEVFTKCIDLLEEILAEPLFPKEGIQRLVEQREVSLKKNRKTPGWNATRLFWQHLYGAHPYAGLTQGDEESINLIDQEKVRHFYEQYYQAKNGSFVVVGDIGSDQVRILSQRISAILPKTSLNTVESDKQKIPPVNSLHPKLKHIHQDLESQQTHIRIGQLSIGRQDPDYINLYIANHVMGGGGLSSVFAREIREKQGWSYSVGSYLQPMIMGGLWAGYLQTANETATLAIDKMKEVIQTSHTYLTDENIQLAMDFLQGNFPLQIDSNQELRDYFSMMAFYDLPNDYLNQVYQKIQNANYEDVRQAWKKHIKSDQLLIISVGDRS